MYERYFKRILDFSISLIAIILLSPLLLSIYILVCVKLGSPAIFKQVRPGKDEVVFTLYKFRTMTGETDENGNLLPDDQRLTSFGKKLRASSLDELPELFNILKGDMAIVGPRPQLVKDMLFMTHEQRKRHFVRQGLTGLAQINGRNAITWEEKINYDLEYIKHITFLNDAKIILITFKKMFKSEGISMEGMETAEDLGEYLLNTGKIDKMSFDKIISELERNEYF